MAIRARVQKMAQRILSFAGETAASVVLKQAAIDREYRALKRDVEKTMPDNLLLKGQKTYCQFDEDGIIQTLFQKLGIERGSFVELGCGDGRENNTHALLLKGWRGVWVDGSTPNINFILTSLPKDSHSLLVEQMFIDADNIAEKMIAWLARLDRNLDLLSIDLDGNDATILQSVLKVAKPKVIIAEYNGKFVPPISVQVKYNPVHTWASDDYYGVSLQRLTEILQDYTLVCCNASGVNSFFVRNDLVKPFKIYKIDQLFMPARNYFVQRRVGAPATLKYLGNMIVNSTK